ncbi:hypothetical protein BPNPMPFG_001660 [Mesorhizobium sp. AR07]|uniref:hypothetical protein n=1 Tax=Mesorhizobium sp. AR07 TaxID=2865838 RepID=UPI00215DF68F|nr:hypothetical protein [Mesorhizobium sp. AR07]UVK46060.1 hypothetical protein BPNPMPFG_001660 [Mesorhizobium sp. AR07]
MNTNIIPFRTRLASRHLAHARFAASASRGSAIASGTSSTRLVCVWRRGAADGRLECRWQKPVSEEGVSRRTALTRFAA